MSKRLDVVRALRDLILAALPDADVPEIDDTDSPARIPPAGRVVVRGGDPGDPEIDLSPLTYNWAHRVPVEVMFEDEATLDAAIGAIGDMIMADRTLGGLCEWIDAAAPSTEGAYIDGAEPPRAGDLNIIAFYSTSSPTG